MRVVALKRKPKALVLDGANFLLGAGGAKNGSWIRIADGGAGYFVGTVNSKTAVGDVIIPDGTEYLYVEIDQPRQFFVADTNSIAHQAVIDLDMLRRFYDVVNYATHDKD